MIKTVISIIIALLILAGLAACQNDGYIGRRFGMWKLVSIDIDGVRDPAYKGDFFWSFQTEVIKMTGPEWESYGICSEENGNMFFNFINHDDKHPEGSQLYSPAPGMHMPANRLMTLRIEKLTSDTMVLLFHAPDDKAYIYTLKKWG